MQDVWCKRETLKVVTQPVLAAAILFAGAGPGAAEAQRRRLRNQIRVTAPLGWLN